MDASQKILIIDDELQIRRFLRVALEANAYAVLEASTGKEGMYKAAFGPSRGCCIGPRPSRHGRIEGS